jgi:Zn-dependent peptidase ImmA (M78 family)/DNA-binding XRE family transcriptional regulator
MVDKAYITPNILKWARESAKMSEETAAAKIKVSVEKLKEWEEGTNYPTIRQAQELAKAYKRPFAVLFLSEIPRDFQPLQDFRRKTAKPLSTASVFIIREIQQKQAWIGDIYAEEGESAIPFVGKFSLTDDPINVAKDILDTLQINPENYNNDYPIKEWVDKAEAKGVFVSRTSFIHTKLKLDCEEIQGFAIADRFAPFIFINSDDWNAPQLFTLVHELAHIWIAASGISSEIEPEAKFNQSTHPIELFCNEVAANALMPTHIMDKINPSSFNSSQEIFRLAKKIGVSAFAFLVRSLNLRKISFNEYRSLKNRAERNFLEFLQKEEQRRIKQKEQQGGPNPYLLRVNKNSKLFTQIVLDAYRGGYIEPTQASSLLSTKINNFPKLEEQIYR